MPTKMPQSTCLSISLFLTLFPLNSFQNSVFTTNGTLLGYSDSTIIKKSRKAAALFGVTWRSTTQSLLNDVNQDSPSNKSAPLLKVLRTIKDADDDEKISTMVVEIDKMVAAICDVKDSLLVAALVNLDSSEAGDPALQSSSTVSNEEGSSRGVKNVSENEGEQSYDEHNGGEEQAPTTTDGDTSKDAENKKSTVTSSKPKPPQIQILIWRVEAMAEALREDLRDFKIPSGTL